MSRYTLTEHEDGTASVIDAGSGRVIMFDGSMRPYLLTPPGDNLYIKGLIATGKMIPVQPSPTNPLGIQVLRSVRIQAGVPHTISFYLESFGGGSLIMGWSQAGEQFVLREDSVFTFAFKRFEYSDRLVSHIETSLEAGVLTP